MSSPGRRQSSSGRAALDGRKDTLLRPQAVASDESPTSLFSRSLSKRKETLQSIPAIVLPPGGAASANSRRRKAYTAAARSRSTSAKEINVPASTELSGDSEEKKGQVPHLRLWVLGGGAALSLFQRPRDRDGHLRTVSVILQIDQPTYHPLALVKVHTIKHPFHFSLGWGVEHICPYK